MDAKYIYKLGKTNTVIFNKTGNLVFLTGKILEAKAVNNFDEQKFIDLISAMSSYSNHHLSETLSEHLKNKILNVLQIEKFEIVSGKGLKASFQHLRLLLGNISLINQYKINIESIKEFINPYLSAGHTVSLFAVGEEIKGYIVFEQKISKDAHKSINLLKNNNIENLLLTGDNSDSAKYVAENLGIIKYLDSMTPDDKINFIQQFKLENTVIFSSDKTSIPTSGVIFVNEKNLFHLVCLILISQEIYKKTQKIFILSVFLLFIIFLLTLLILIF